MNYKLNIIMEKQIELLNIIQTKKLPCWLNNEFYFISEKDLQTHYESKHLYKHPQAFNNNNIRNWTYQDILRDNPKILNNMLTLKKDSDWGVSFITTMTKIIESTTYHIV